MLYPDIYAPDMKSSLPDGTEEAGEGLDIIGREKFFMKKMKRAAALAMASVTAISLVGCGGSNTTTTADTKAAGESSAEGGNSGDISGNITFSWWDCGSLISSALSGNWDRSKISAYWFKSAKFVPLLE